MASADNMPFYPRGGDLQLDPVNNKDNHSLKINFEPASQILVLDETDSPTTLDDPMFIAEQLKDYHKAKIMSVKGMNSAEKKRIDYVLVYNNKQEEEVFGRRRKSMWMKHKQNRDKFKKSMLDRHLQMQEIVCGQHVFVKVHAPFEVLCKQAEIMKLQMPLKGYEIYDDGPEGCCTRFYNNYLRTDDEVDFVSAPFIYDKKHLFENIQDEEEFFRPALRSYLTHQILIHLDIREKVDMDNGDDDSLAKKGLPYLLLKGSYKDAFIPHEESTQDPIVNEIITERVKAGSMSPEAAEQYKERKYRSDPRHDMDRTWRKWTKYQPMWKIRNYFGEKVAFYFAWSGQLISSLWIPSLLGFCIFIYGLYLSLANYASPTATSPTSPSSITPSAPVTTPSALSDVVNNMEDLLEAIKESFDNKATPFFSLIICLWGTLFLETWKRKRAVLAYEWDVDGFEAAEPNRPDFYGTKKRPDPVTNLLTWYYPLERQFVKFAASCSVLFIMVGIVLISGLGVVVYRIIISVDYCSSMAPWQCLLASTIGSALLNAVSILLLGKLYEYVAYKLTDWENHRTRSDYDNALIIKLFAFQFANSYSSLVYIAFFRGNLKSISRDGLLGLGAKYVDKCSGANGDNCMSMLSFQVLVLMVLKPFPKLIKDVILPFLKKLWRSGRICSCCRRNKIRDSIIAIDLCDCNDYIDRERIKPQLGDFTLSEYTEKVIQYGYLMLFSTSLPLAPLIALVTNLADLRVDATRLIWVYRRPVPYMACDIGMWFGILEFVNICGVISNAFLIAFTSDFGKIYLPTMEQKLWAVIVFEQIVFFIKLFISKVLPYAEHRLEIAMDREKYQVARILAGDAECPKAKRVSKSRSRHREHSMGNGQTQGHSESDGAAQ